MTFKHGKNAGMKWNSNDISACIDDISFDRLIALAETTAMSTSSAVYTSRVAGVVDIKVSIGGPYDPSVLEGTGGLETDWLAGTARAVKIQQDTTGAATTSSPSYTMTMLCENIKVKTGVGGVAKWTGDFAIASGSLVRATSGAW